MRLLNRLFGEDPRLQRAEREHKLRVVELEKANAELEHLQKLVGSVGQQSQMAEAELVETVDEVAQSRPFHLELGLPDATAIRRA
jgi:arginine deiminase